MNNPINDPSIKANVVYIQNQLQLLAKTGAKRIIRVYQPDSDMNWTRLYQKDLNSFYIHHVSNTVSGTIHFVNNEIVRIVISVDKVRYHGAACAGKVDKFFDEVKAVLFANSPRGLLKDAIVKVRDYLQLSSKGASGRVKRTIQWNGDTYQAWCTAGGGFVLSSVNAKKEVYLELSKGELCVSYEEYYKKYDYYRAFDDKQSCKRSVKLLHQMFGAVFQEKDIQVQ